MTASASLRERIRVASVVFVTGATFVLCPATNAFAQGNDAPPLPPSEEPSTDVETPPDGRSRVDAEPPSSAPAEPPVVTTPAGPSDATGAAPASGPTNGPTPMGGFFPDSGFVLKSSDDQFRLRFRLQSVIRGQVVMDGKATISNPFLTLRPVLEGNLYRPWIRFWTSLDLAANPVYLLDSYVEIQPIDQIGIRVGQQWTPFSRHEYLYGPHQLLLPEWDPIADYFWSGRDKGATLFGSLFGKKVDWFLGGYIGAPLRQFETIRGNYLFVARLAVNPLGTLGDTEFAYAEKDSPAPFRYSIGVNGYTSKLQRGVENFNPNSFSFDVTPSGLTTINHTIGADFILQSSRFTTLAEGYFRRTDERNGSPAFSSAGAFVQAGLLVYERLVDVSVRGTWADVNLQHDDDRTLGIEAASTYYIHGPMVAVKLRYAYADQKGVSGESTSGGAQLPVAPGHLHVLTAQLNTSF